LNAFAPKTFRFDKWFDALLRGNKNAIHFTKMKSRHIWIYFLLKKSETISKVGIHIQLSKPKGSSLDTMAPVQHIRFIMPRKA
jgi:hypothetical protein